MFGKKKEVTPESLAAEESDGQQEEKHEESSAPAGIGQLSAGLEKLKAQFSSFYEMQKAANERFSRINEQIGELRAMIIERDRASQHLEAKATQAIDLVETIQPEKLMIEVRKEDSKIEALRANIESNEVVMKNIVSELKDMRQRLTAFKGMEEVVKLNDEVKKELSQIKLVEGVVERHAGKVDTIFAEMQKGFGEYASLTDTLKSLDQTSKQLSGDMDSIKVRLKEFSGKKELATLTNRVNEFEKKVSSAVDMLNKRFQDFEARTAEHVEDKLERADKLLKGFEALAAKTPDLDKYFNLLTEEAKKGEHPKVEKIKQPGQDENPLDEAAAKPTEKKGLLGKFAPGKKK